MEEGNKHARKSHRKSRNGCVRCKKRHIKCDETKPSCQQCTNVKHRCSFLDVIPRADILKSHTAQSESTTSLSLPQQAAASSSSAISTQPDDNGVLNILHLSLLHQLEHGGSFWGSLGLPQSDKADATSAIIILGLVHPYLLHEMLSFASLHMSHSDPARKEYYLYHATALQTQALSLFNSPTRHQDSLTREKEQGGPLTPIDKDNHDHLAPFFFSAFLGAHNLHDALSFSNTDPTAYIDNFISYLRVARGVTTQINGASWTSIPHSPFRAMFNYSQDIPAPETAHSSSLDDLSTLLSSSTHLTPETREIYNDAMRHLSSAWAAHDLAIRDDVDKERYRGVAISAIFTFPIRVAREYTDLLEQRRPEALAILARFGGLVGEYGDVWIFGAGGLRLVDVVRRSLGAYWEEWISSPRE